MELIKKATLLLIFSITVFACQADKDVEEQVDSFNKKSIDFKEPFKNTIGFTDAETDEFVEIQQEDLIDHWKKSLELDEDVSFSSMELVKVNNDDESYLMITAKSDSGRVNVTSKASVSDKGIMLSGETCTCKSTNCGLGCEVLSMCKCSACARNGECEKTHIVSELSRASFPSVQ